MPKTIEIEVYQFNELSTKAKERAVNYYHEHWMQDDWSYPTLDYMKEEGHRRGFNVNDIRYRGFYSQGDGASWCGSVRVADWIASKPTTYQEHPTTQIILALIAEGWVSERVLVSFSPSRYCHEETMDFTDLDHYYSIEDDSVLAEGMFKGAEVGDLMKVVGCEEGALFQMDEEIKEDCKAFAREIYRALEDDYESMTTEEAIAESFNCNEIYFHENGAIA